MALKTMCCKQKISYLINMNSILVRKYCTSFKESKFYDIIIAGGGLVGTAMACSLAQNSKLADKKVLLLEGGPDRKWVLSPSYSNRVVSINPGTRKLFESLQVWPHIARMRYKTVKKMQVWESHSDALITFNNPEFIDDVSYIIENDVILASLDEVLKTLDGRIEKIFNAKVEDIDISNVKNYVSVQTADKKVYRCNFLIGAEGVNSKTRQKVGGQFLTWQYKQKGIVATLRLSEPTENVVAWQRFLPTGPIALLPLTDELSSLVWSTSTTEADRLLKLKDDEFVDAVNDALWKQYPVNSFIKSASESLNKIFETFSMNNISVHQLQPSITSVISGSRAAFPLSFGHATKYVAPRIALIGDAAHKVHPLAGQGVNLGFGDIHCLTEIIAEAAYSGTDIGNLQHLLEYESKRQKYNFPTMVAIDGLHRIYGTTFTPLVLVRSLGLQTVHSLEPVKKYIMKYASC